MRVLREVHYMNKQLDVKIPAKAEAVYEQCDKLRKHGINLDQIGTWYED